MRHSDQWQFRILRDSKRHDLAKGLYDSANFIDTEFLLHMNEKQQSRCFYCEIPMAQHVRSIRQGMTLERLDITKGHIKSNCVLCCKSCNSKKLHRDTDLVRNILNKCTLDIVLSERRPCMV